MVGTGAGVCIPKLRWEEGISLGLHATVFQAEVFAIMRCAEAVEEAAVEERKVRILSDSQATIKALSGLTVTSKMVKECMRELDFLGIARKVGLEWIPDHQGVEGNEKADELAKEGLKTAFIGLEPVLALFKQKIKTEIDKWVERYTNKSWRERAYDK